MVFIDLKICAVGLASSALLANVSGVSMDEGIIKNLVGLGATGVLGLITWRLIDKLGTAVDKNTEVLAKMRAHCASRLGESEDDPEDRS